MRRFTQSPVEEVYDLVIAGGGIYGAALAYTASLNGIKTVLLEKDDFVSHASANSQKVIHGGLRYLQTLDIKRVVESIREKQRYYHLFPHLVEPLACVLPTSGYTTKSNEAFRLAFLIYRLIQQVVCKNKLDAHLQKKPHLLSKSELEERFSHLAETDVRGGALWYDGICLAPERVVMSLLWSSCGKGTEVANYMKLNTICRINDSTLEVTAQDRLHGGEISIKTRKIALCTGTWFKDEYSLGGIPPELARLSLIRGMNLILPSLFQTKTSLAAKVRTSEESRFLFMVPWKNRTIAGTHWEHCPKMHNETDAWPQLEKRVEEFKELIAKAIDRHHGLDSVQAEHVGCVPGDGLPETGKSAAKSILSHYQLVNREQQQTIDVLQIVGVKFTTAFDVVQKALKKLFPNTKIKDVLAFDNLPAGSFTGSRQNQVENIQKNCHNIVTADQVSILFSLVGNDTEYIVNTYLSPLRNGTTQLTDLQLYEGLARYCVKEELCFHLSDLIYRRLFPDTPIVPHRELLNKLADILAELLSWTEQERHEQIRRAKQRRYTDS